MQAPGYDEAIKPLHGENEIPELPDFELKISLNSRADTKGPPVKELIYLLYTGWRYRTPGGTYLARKDIIDILNTSLRSTMKPTREALFRTFDDPNDELTVQIQENLKGGLEDDLQGRFDRWASAYWIQNPEVHEKYIFYDEL